jgi:myo-inositol 2-dehydrogenase / D-chiro-inositol 1-dehydrogenase
MPREFRLGLAGAGRMGRTHLRALNGSDLVTVAAIAEPSAPSREAVAGLGVPVHGSVAALVDREALDGVLICAPTDAHAEVIAEVVAAGLPVLCEKPCGVSPEQAAAAAGIAAAAGVPLQVAYWRRYVPQLRELRERILRGELGFVHLICCYQWDASPPPAAFRVRSGGIFVDMGVHEFDQLRWLSGQEIGPLHVAAAGADPSGDVDSAELIAQLSGGSVGLVSLGRYHRGGDMARAEAFGTRDTACCPFLTPEEGERAQLAALRAQAEDFARQARGESAGSGTGAVGATAADAVAALEAARRASALLR